MRTVTIPVELRVDGVRDSDGKVSVSLLRKDRSDPHKLCLQFSLSRADLKTGQMCFIVYGTLREEMFRVLKQKPMRGMVARTVGRSVPRKKKRTVSG